MTILFAQKRLAVFALASAFPVCLAAAEAPGIPRFQQVSERVFRGGQPSPEAWPHLAKMGIKTVIDLRRVDEHSTTDEAKAVTAAGMKYINVPMKGVVSPPDATIAKLLALLDGPDPVFIHCKRGADRTGVVVACYRVAREGWDRKRALKEAESIGMKWTQFGLKSYIKDFDPPEKGLAVDATAVEK